MVVPKTSPPLVWADGRPMIREQLTQRVAGPSITGVRSILTGHPAQGLTPGKLGMILRQAEQGDATAYLELAEEMEEKDLHYLAVLKKRKEAIAQLPITVVPADDSAEAKADAALIEEFIARDELQDEVVDMLDAIGKGYSITEIVWEMSANLWMPLRLERCDQRYFEFDRVDGETLRLRSDGGQLEDLAAAKYIIHRVKAKSGSTVRGGIARAAAWHYVFKNYAWKDWVSFLETYGMPIRLGRYDNGETEENKRILLNALAQLGSDAAAMFPKTMDVEFMDAKAGTAPGDLWTALIDKCDEYLSKVVLGQTNTTDAKSGGLGSGQADVHREVEETIERSDARRLSTTLNRDLVVPIIMLNRGERRRYPKVRVGRPDEADVEAMGKAAQIFVPMGMKVSMKKMQEAVGLPTAEAGEEVLSIGGAAPPETDPDGQPLADPKNAQRRPVKEQEGGQGRRIAATSFFAPLRGQKRASEGLGVAADQRGQEGEADFIDLTADAMLSDWQELLEPMVAGIEGQMEGAASLEDMRDRLITSLEDMDDSALTDLLTRAGIAARLQGELDVQEEQ